MFSEHSCSKISFYCFVMTKIHIFKLKVFLNFFMNLQTVEYKRLYSSFSSERYINECDFVFSVFVHSNPLLHFRVSHVWMRANVEGSEDFLRRIMNI